MTSKRRFAARRGNVPQSGPGSPTYIMAHHLKGLLRRLRAQKPFPLPVVEFLTTIYPKELFTPTRSDDETTRWANLLGATNYSHVAHFSVVGRTDDQTFWVRTTEMEEAVPTPLDISRTLLFSKENPHFDVVSRWLDDALELHMEINALTDVCSRFVHDAVHPEHVRRIWPELGKFIGEVPDLGYVEPIQDTQHLRIIKRVRDEITTALAKAVLLPEAECLAWVQFPEGGQ